MTTYKTPDVIIEEISVFPPSVAEVESAIPAFVGYTEMAQRLTPNDLLDKPTRIKSLLEYEFLYGFGPAVDLQAVELDGSNAVLSVKQVTTFFLYDSLRLFFDNGGGPCYIVSVGNYSATRTSAESSANLKRGVEKVKAFDEPTILLFPDAAGLTGMDLSTVQTTALAQCAALKDRVAVLDTRFADPEGADFRDKIGINNLKYGAAYTPWLNTAYPKKVGYTEIAKPGILNKEGSAIVVKDLTSDKDILALITAVDDAFNDSGKVAQQFRTAGNTKTIAGRQRELVTEFDKGQTIARAQDLFLYLYTLAKTVDAFVSTDTTKKLAQSQFISDIDQIKTKLIPAYSALIAFERELGEKLTPANSYTSQFVNGPVGTSDWGKLFDAATAPAASVGKIPAEAADNPARLQQVLKHIKIAFEAVSPAMDSIASAAVTYRDLAETNLLKSFDVLRNIINEVSNWISVCPPSGAIAGVYATVDNQRGVWKAPANVSLNGVISPTHAFDLDQTDRLNVDDTAGKSINAIRAFSGRGTLVWGARTLAGNDNEWRYISVRRFFNMVEESIKKSTYWAVFEPNDANTWVKVRGMIENYLTQKWREGALAGATIKEAFFVRCALGVTMNSQDILEGRMIVEIGMAVVRPAEFIIMKFSHKLQTS